jgi:uncharacterized protein
MGAAGFFDAIKTGDLSRVEALLEADPELASAKDDNGVSAVLTSIYRGQGEIRDMLLAQNPQLEIYDAAATGNLDRVKVLVDKDPSLAKSYSPDGFPVVALAAFFGQADVVRYLFDQGANLNAVANNGTGYTALTGAVAGGHLSIVKFLLENGADANHRYGQGYSPLLTAAANGHLEITKLLITAGADVTVRTDDGQSAADLAAKREHPDIVSYLKKLPAAATGR